MLFVIRDHWFDYHNRADTTPNEMKQIVYSMVWCNILSCLAARKHFIVCVFEMSSIFCTRMNEGSAHVSYD